MRPDQLMRLAALQEKILDTVLVEADPSNWPGGDTLPMNMTQEDRGDRYWCKKNAAATFTLLTKAVSLSNYKGENGGITQSDPHEDLEKEIAAAERAAIKKLEKFQQRYDKTVIN